MTAPIPESLTPQEQEMVSSALAKVRQRVDSWHARYLAEQDDSVEPGSSLAADNRLTDPFHISQLAYNYLGVGTDCLSVLLRASVTYTDDGSPTLITNPHGLFPNLRTGLDVACTAAWLLGTPDRKARVRARLILHMQEMHDETSANEALVEAMLAVGKTPVSTAVADDGKKWADGWAAQRAEELNLTRMRKNCWPTNGKIVQTGAALAGLSGPHYTVLWRSLSGATHGAWWATSLLSREVVRDEPHEPTVEARLSLSVPVFTALLWNVTEILEYGWVTFDRRRRAPQI